MTTWHDVEQQAPELAGAVRARFEADKHHVLATLRRGGAPRVSGTEVDFTGDDLTIGSMYGAVKARDLQRDGRFALHSNPGDESMADGDAKISGIAVEVPVEAGRPGPPRPYHLFRLEPTEVVLTTVEGDHLRIRSWRPGEGERSVTRE